jgi:uncharacterized protein (DUF1330 family)
MPKTRCYMIIQAAFTDRERFMATYQVAVAPLVEAFGGRYVMVGRNLLVLEGDFPATGFVLSVWPDRDAALRFWNSPEYARVKTLRAGTGRFQVSLVDGPLLAEG